MMYDIEKVSGYTLRETDQQFMNVFLGPFLPVGSWQRYFTATFDDRVRSAISSPSFPLEFHDVFQECNRSTGAMHHFITF